MPPSPAAPPPPTTWSPLDASLASARRPPRRRGRWSTVAAGVVLVAVLAAILVGWPRLGDAARPTAGDETRPEPAATTGDDPAQPLERGREAEAGGLDPGLVAAFEEARLAASAAGVELPIASGYRSADEQLALLEAETAERGSREEALHWVFPPDRSMHVRGLAIDVNNGPGADWLHVNGANFGLCRTLEWEWWHFEWRQRWRNERRCPAPATTPDEAPPP